MSFIIPVKELSIDHRADTALIAESLHSQISGFVGDEIFNNDDRYRVLIEILGSCMTTAREVDICEQGARDLLNMTLLTLHEISLQSRSHQPHLPQNLEKMFSVWQSRIFALLQLDEDSKNAHFRVLHNAEVQKNLSGLFFEPQRTLTHVQADAMYQWATNHSFLLPHHYKMLLTLFSGKHNPPFEQISILAPVELPPPKRLMHPLSSGSV